MKREKTQGPLHDVARLQARVQSLEGAIDRHRLGRLVPTAADAALYKTLPGVCSAQAPEDVARLQAIADAIPKGVYHLHGPEAVTPRPRLTDDQVRQVALGLATAVTRG